MNTLSQILGIFVVEFGSLDPETFLRVLEMFMLFKIDSAFLEPKYL